MAKAKGKAKTSPIKLVCKRPFAQFGDDMLVCYWKCVGKVHGAQFRHRKRPDLFAILHPSTKREGWQMSYFDERGASGDHINESCEAALKHAAFGKDWKLEEVS